MAIRPVRYPSILAAVLLTAISALSGCGRPSSASTEGEQPQTTVESQTTQIAAYSPNEPKEISETASEQPAAVLQASPRPPADRSVRRPGDAEKITFDDLNLGMQTDVVFREFMLNGNDRVKELDGKRVSLTGYMHPGVASSRGIKEFILLRNKECKFGPGGQADHLAQVYLRAGETTDFTPGPVKVEANLKVHDFRGPDDNTWSIYRLEDAVVR